MAENKATPKPPTAWEIAAVSNYFTALGLLLKPGQTVGDLDPTELGEMLDDIGMTVERFAEINAWMHSQFGSEPRH
jgi:hypothetical protein